MAKVYWIHLYEHCEPDKEGYVGVSVDAETRVQKHLWALHEGKHENIHLTHAYLLYGSNGMIHSILYEGEEDVCYAKEKELRPTENIGWNIAVGGSKPPDHTGKPKSENMRKKLSETLLTGNHWSKRPDAANIAYRCCTNRGKSDSKETKQRKKQAANTPKRLEASRTGGILGAQRRWGGK